MTRSSSKSCSASRTATATRRCSAWSGAQKRPPPRSERKTSPAAASDVGQDGDRSHSFAGQKAGLLHPSGELSFVELVVLSGREIAAPPKKTPFIQGL